jgi:hypothetical protein
MMGDSQHEADRPERKTAAKLMFWKLGKFSSFETRQHERDKAGFFAIPFPKSTGAVMADNPDTRPKEVTVPVSDSPHAPFIFYEIAPAFGFTNGVVNITLSANRTWIGPNGVMNEQVVTAYLRGNIQAALSLRQAIDSALLLATPTPEGKAN